MQLVERKDLDTEKWNALVKNSGASVFSSAKYLDAVSDNWSVLFSEDYSGGIVCPYAVKLGVKVLYAPFFHRQIEWVGGNRPSEKVLIEKLKKHFKVADAQLNFNGNFNFQKRFHQEITREAVKKNQQVKRMLKKAERFEVIPELQSERLLELLKSELSHRIAGINDHSLSLLKKLVGSFDFSEIVQLNLLEKSEWKGAIWLLPFNNRVLYLKGTVVADAKESGGMYRLINEAMELAFKENAVFDFGGSNSEGVRRFNKNWGSEDRFYYHLQWNNAPLWWKISKSLRSAWKRK